MEALKFAGAVCWVLGFIALMVSPVVGLMVLFLAVMLTIRTVSATRERRHQELLDAAKRTD